MTDTVNTRELVLGILLEVTGGKEYSHIAIRNVLEKYQYLDKQKRALITRTAEGTLENLILIDYIINQFSTVKVNKMKPVIRNILRMSVYELKFMDSIPGAATCNEAVKLAERKGFRNLKGFVNGVLRNISRNLENITYPDKEKNETEYLSIMHSMPQWILEQWMSDYGMKRTKEILDAFVGNIPVTVRTNLAKLTPEELEAVWQKEGVTFLPSTELDYAFYLSGFDYLQNLDSFEQGLYYVQDISSMRVAELAAPREGDCILDVCGAPGGKSIHLAEKMNGTGKVEARDLTKYKVDLINENIERLHLKNIEAVEWDATVADERWKEKADIVIADLPCSGLGIMAKKTDIRYNVTPQKEKELQKLQREILSTVRSYVAPGGALIYSTCTMDRLENEDNVSWFEKEFPEFELKYSQQIFPVKGKNDGFFLARFLRK